MTVMTTMTPMMTAVIKLIFKSPDYIWRFRRRIVRMWWTPCATQQPGAKMLHIFKLCSRSVSFWKKKEGVVTNIVIIIAIIMMIIAIIIIIPIIIIAIITIRNVCEPSSRRECNMVPMKSCYKVPKQQVNIMLMIIVMIVLVIYYGEHHDHDDYDGDLLWWWL